MRLSSGGGEAVEGRGGAGGRGRDGSWRNRREVSLPEALYTVDDAREMMTVNKSLDLWVSG